MIHMHSCFPRRVNRWLHVPMETRCQVSLPFLGYHLPHFFVFPCQSLCRSRSGDLHSWHTLACHLCLLSLGLLPAALFWSWEWLPDRLCCLAVAFPVLSSLFVSRIHISQTLARSWCGISDPYLCSLSTPHHLSSYYYLGQSHNISHLENCNIPLVLPLLLYHVFSIEQSKVSFVPGRQTMLPLCLKPCNGGVPGWLGQ